MNKLLSVASIGSKGLNTDLPQWELPAEFVTEGRNFKVLNNALQAHGGWDYIKKEDNTNSFYHIIQTIGVNQDLFLLATNQKLFILNGIYLNEALALSSAVTDPSQWSFDHAGGIIVINHPEKGAWYWSPITATGTIAPLIYSEADIPNTGDPQRLWDTANKKFAKIIRVHKNFIFMLNLIEDTTFMQDGFRWSHPFAPNALPVTWDETSQFHLAGIANLGASTGFIIDGHTLRDSFIIYSSEATNALDATGDELVWRRRQISGSTGLLSKDCIVEVNGVHAFIANNGAVLNDGSQLKHIMDNRVRKSFISKLSPTDYKNSFAVKNVREREIWFCIPTVDNAMGFCDLAYIWNYNDDTWSVRDLPYTTSHATYGSRRSQTDFYTWTSLNIPSPKKWSDMVDPWYSVSTPFDDTIIGTSIDTAIYDLNTDVNRVPSGLGSILNTFIERTNYALEGQVAATTLVSILPYITGGPVRIRMGSHKMKGAPVVWDSWKEFDPATQRKLSVRTTGTLHAWQIESIGDNSFSFSGFDIEYSMAGLR